MASLLRRNLLHRILQRPGARAVPYSAGEAISRFRDDVQVVVRFLTWTADPMGQTIVACLALFVLVRVNPLVTVAVFLPLVAVLTVVNMANKRIRRYRRASQEAHRGGDRLPGRDLWRGAGRQGGGSGGAGGGALRTG